uniref:Uncharacterized protein n=1 Tax=Arundo donax TaxID=35708 RepID=A0A0A9C6F2_ARUDO
MKSEATNSMASVLLPGATYLGARARLAWAEAPSSLLSPPPGLTKLRCSRFALRWTCSYKVSKVTFSLFILLVKVLNVQLNLVQNHIIYIERVLVREAVSSTVHISQMLINQKKK